MNTLGWDSVYAVGLESANSALSKNRASLLTNFAITQPEFDLKGKFGQWKLVAGGSGTHVYLELPIESGSLSTGAPPKSVNLAGVSVTVEVSLGLLPTPGAVDRKSLVFELVGEKPQNQEEPAAVNPKFVTDPHSVLSPAQKIILKNAIPLFLSQNAAKVSFAFAHAGGLDAAVPPWLTPVRSAFTYAAPEGKGAGYLAILSVHSAKDTSGLAHQVDPELFAGEGEAFLAISKELFLLNVVAPALAEPYQGKPVSSFSFDKATETLHGRSLRLNPMKAYGLGPFEPVVGDLSATVNSDQISIKAVGSCDCGAGETCTFSVGGSCRATFDPPSKAVRFQNTSSATPEYRYHYPPGAIIDEFGVALYVSEELAKGISSQVNKSSAGSYLVQHVPVGIQWAGASLNVTQAGLNGGMYLRGKLA